jgi:hypothetical protein
MLRGEMLLPIQIWLDTPPAHEGCPPMMAVGQVKQVSGTTGILRVQ